MPILLPIAKALAVALGTALVAPILAAIAIASPAVALKAQPPMASPVLLLSASDYLCSGVYLGGGRVLTAAHCENPKLKVVTESGESVTATVIWADKARDLMELQVRADLHAKPAHLSCRTPAVGEHVTSAGNPEGMLFLQTEGIVAGAPRPVGHWEMIVPVALTMLGGMSGGPVFDDKGELVGINVGGMIAEVVDPKDRKKVVGLAPTGINFIVSGELACKAVAEHVNV